MPKILYLKIKVEFRCITLPKQLLTQRWGSLSQTDLVPDALGHTSIPIAIEWFIQSVQCIGWKNCSFSKQTSSRMDPIFLMSLSGCTRGWNCQLELNRAHKNLFLSASCFVEDRLSLYELEPKLKFGGFIGCGDSYLELLLTTIFPDKTPSSFKKILLEELNEKGQREITILKTSCTSRYQKSLGEKFLMKRTFKNVRTLLSWTRSLPFLTDVG